VDGWANISRPRADDDPNTDDGCETPGRRVFVTDGAYSVPFNDIESEGMAGADAICQSRADDEGLTGLWLAWMSDRTIDASDRLEPLELPNAPYIQLNGAVVANGWDDLTNGNLVGGISITEFGVGLAEDTSVWTGTDAMGESTGVDCFGWLVEEDSGDGATVGSTALLDDGWTATNEPLPCDSADIHLYCFEQ